ncbi:hypothetical protein I553_3168 [Mycobacterium xenopi 4042]|uniref:Uncharacterized protein n=1 Tax=Mycobacterium xenopi 4042 TaxID=1299334 RepID=X8E513_MYCXE|nr:hypothetical protein I553_3168 [Mycobacterium xenopi 4042]
MNASVLDELGYYLLAGAGGDGPATLMDEAAVVRSWASAPRSSPNGGTSKKRRRSSARRAR